MTETDRESWLRGSVRHGCYVQVTSGLHCAGCGRLCGVFCWLPPVPGEEWPEPPSSWPFNEADCPVCQTEANIERKAELSKLLKVKLIADCIVQSHGESTVSTAKAILAALDEYNAGKD